MSNQTSNQASTQTMSWNEWVGAIYHASDGKLDYSGFDQDVAEVDHPLLYASYRSGSSPETYVAQHLVTYEDGHTAHIDPDDDGDVPDDEYGSSDLAQAHRPAEARLLAALSSEQIQFVVAWLQEEARLHQQHADTQIAETLRYMGHRLEHR